MTRRPPRVGRRGAYLLLFGSGWIGFGLALVLHIESYPGIPLLANERTLDGFGLVWLLSGLLADVLAFLPRWRDAGFYVIALMPTVWSVLFWWGFVVAVLPGSAGYTRGWVSGLMFGVFSGSVWIVAGMVDVREIEVTNGASGEAGSP